MSTFASCRARTKISTDAAVHTGYGRLNHSTPVYIRKGDTMITIEQLPEQNIADKVIYVLNKVEPKFHILFGSVSKNVQKMKKNVFFF
jgi:hypothetical protein